MATILTKKKDTTGAPVAGDLTNSAGGAELAVNTADKRLYTKDSGGNVVEVGTNPGTAVTFTAGTVSAPAITTTGDTNTGVFFPAADTIAFAEGGAEAMRINSDSQVVTTAGTASLPAITTTGDVNTGIFFPAADTIAFAEGGAEAMRIDSSGNVGIGVTPSAWGAGKALDIGNSGALWGDGINQGWFTALTQNAYADASLNWKYKTSSIPSSRYQLDQNTHKWYIAPSGTAGNTITFTQAMTLDASGNLLLGTTTAGLSGVRQYIDGNGTVYRNSGTTIGFTYVDSGGLQVGTNGATPLLLLTNNAERARITSGGNLDLQKNLGLGGASATTSGTGITFPATQSASSDANTLDDYEEGTWTPTLLGVTTEGTTTYTLQTGTYTKIGRLVVAYFDVAISAATGTGAIKIGGFPFTAARQLIGTGSPVFYNVTFSGAPNTLFNTAGDSEVRLSLSSSGSGVSYVQVENASREYVATVVYYTT